MGFRVTIGQRGLITEKVLNTDENEFVVDGTMTLSGTLNGVIYSNNTFNSSTVFTSSNGGVTFYTTGAPKSAVTGLISSGSSVTLTMALSPNFCAQNQVRATVQNTLSATIYTKSIVNHTTYLSGSTPVLDFSSVGDDNFFTVPITFTTTLNATGLVHTLTCNTGSNYRYAIVADLSEYGF